MGDDIDHLIENVIIKANDTIELTHNYLSGKVSVAATNGTENCDALVYLTSKKTGSRSGIGRSYGKSSISEITPGIYDIGISPLDIKGINLEHTYENVEVKVKDDIKITHNVRIRHSLGRAKTDENLVDVLVQILDPSTKSLIYEARTFKSPFSNPLKTILKPGTYEIKVSGVKEYEGKSEKFTVEILPGETIERNFEFSLKNN